MENNTNNNTPSTIEELAIMIQRTMASKEDLKAFATKDDLMAVNEGLEEGLEEGLKGLRNEMNAQFRGVNDHLEHLDARVGRIEADIHELRGEVVYRHEFEDVLGRVKYLERKLGIESGV